MKGVSFKNDVYVVLDYMKKIMVTVSDETDEKLRRYVEKTYYGRRGALSIVVETSVREFLERNGVKSDSE